MDIDALVAAVIDETGRPDKSALINRAVRGFVLKAHSLDFFPQDRIVENVTPSSPANLIIETLPTRWKKFNQIRPVDSSTNLPIENKVFHRKDPENIYSFEGTVIQNYYYVLGSSVTIESVNQINKFQWIYYEYPNITAGSATTWITERYEEELIDGANAYVYKKLGDSTSARLNLELWNGDPRVRGDRGHRGRIIADNLIENV